MEEDKLYLKKHPRMIAMQDNGLMVNFMDRVSMIGKMDLIMKDTINLEKSKALANLHSRIKIIIMDIGSMGNNMEEEYYTMLMGNS